MGAQIPERSHFDNVLSDSLVGGNVVSIVVVDPSRLSLRHISSKYGTIARKIRPHISVIGEVWMVFASSAPLILPILMFMLLAKRRSPKKYFKEFDLARLKWR